MHFVREIAILGFIIFGFFLLCQLFLMSYFSLDNQPKLVNTFEQNDLSSQKIIALNKRSPSQGLFSRNHLIRQLSSKKNRLRKHFKMLNKRSEKRIIVAGGAGFVGSHLVDSLMRLGHSVIVIDNLFTGTTKNIEHWFGHPRFEYIQHDVSKPIYLDADEVYNLASPASPSNYMENPIKTLKANLLGSINLLGLSRRTRATFLYASSSEVYGDPLVHPQPESYWGNVNPIGLRSCYDEGKRAAESLVYAYFRRESLPVRVARIFNTYGPRMQLDDGRVVSNFILQALSNQDICLYGDGSFTRSFMFISDLVDGLIGLMNSNVTEPVNLGNPHEFSIHELALIVTNLTESSSKIVNCPEAVDDPRRRQPDIKKARRFLNWEPKVQLIEGLKLTIKAFRESLRNSSVLPRQSERRILHEN